MSRRRTRAIWTREEEKRWWWWRKTVIETEKRRWNCNITFSRPVSSAILHRFFLSGNTWGTTLAKMYGLSYLTWPVTTAKQKQKGFFFFVYTSALCPAGEVIPSFQLCALPAIDQSFRWAWSKKAEKNGSNVCASIVSRVLWVYTRASLWLNSPIGTQEIYTWEYRCTNKSNTCNGQISFVQPHFLFCSLIFFLYLPNPSRNDNHLTVDTKLSLVQRVSPCTL